MKFVFAELYGCIADYPGCDYDSECPGDEKCCRTHCDYYECDADSGEVCNNYSR